MHPHTWTFNGCLTFGYCTFSPFFLQTLFGLRNISNVVSSVKITSFQSRFKLSFPHLNLFSLLASVRRGFSIGLKYPYPASFNRRQTVLELMSVCASSISCTICFEDTFLFFTAIWTIALSSSVSVFLFLPLPSLSHTSPVLSYLKTQRRAVSGDHPTYVAADLNPSLGPSSWRQRKTISQRFCTESAIFMRNFCFWLQYQKWLDETKFSFFDQSPIKWVC